MINSVSDTAITQADIDALLARLKELREQITAAQEAIAPLEANLALAYGEFQAVVGHLRREVLRFRAETASLRYRIDGLGRTQDEMPGVDDKNAHYEAETGQITTTSTATDPEAVEKDVLLEHLFRVLDPMVDDKDAELLANLQGMCNNPAVSLADVLEELPWGSAWSVKSPKEELIDQYHRLKVWEQALVYQLDGLRRKTERLQEDPRYGLWQQRQKGPDDWRRFLNEAADQQQELNDKLAAELDSLREKWARIVKAEEYTANDG
jgi:hypothetical protein